MTSDIDRRARFEVNQGDSDPAACPVCDSLERRFERREIRFLGSGRRAEKQNEGEGQ